MAPSRSPPWPLLIDALTFVLFVASGCAAPTRPVELIPTSPDIIGACAKELGTTYCSAAAATAAAQECSAQLTPAEQSACDPKLGCLVSYDPESSGKCVSGPTYSTLAQCANPVEDNCAFYRSCLEAAHPCGDGGYALGFGEPLCYLFIADRAEFTPAGQHWLEGVRTCLQRELAPLVSTPVASCDALADEAFATHTTCYTVPDNSFCDLGSDDVTALSNLLAPYLDNPRVVPQIEAVTAICNQHS